tara:strand:- start:771 stop:1154 length:384 start_codon:yes stop_codon:yes gene_type:complete
MQQIRKTIVELARNDKKQLTGRVGKCEPEFQHKKDKHRDEQAMTASDNLNSATSGQILDRLREYEFKAQLVEVVYRDGAGQICTVHDVVRDIFSRAGQDFILLGRGTMLPFDRVLMLEGQPISSALG